MKKRRAAHSKTQAEKELPLHPWRLMLYLLYTVVLLCLFYFVFKDFRVYSFLQDLLERATDIDFIIYPVSFIIGFPLVWNLYYEINTPFIEDALSYPKISRSIVERLEDVGYHELVHLVIYSLLFAVRLIALWPGSTLALALYGVLWGGALMSFTSTIFSFRPFGLNELKYYEAKTRRLRTGKQTPHSISIRQTVPFVFVGELVVFILFCLYD